MGIRRERYEIRVAGRLGSSWADWFDGLEIREEPGRDGRSTTTLLAGTMDQAGLHGTLGKIRDLGILLLSVQIAPQDKEE